MNQQTIQQSQTHNLDTNKVLRNTYALLGLSFIVSCVGAGVSMALGLSSLAGLVCTLIGFGLLFVVHKTAESSNGLIAMFAFTLFMGAGIGPMLTRYLSLPNGGELVFQALGATALVFFALSAYAISSKKDFSNIAGFLITGLIIAIVASIANWFMQIPALQLAISSAVVFIMSGFILYDTSRIINGGEDNYIRAAIAMYLNLYNLFVNLLVLMGFASDE